MTAQDVARDGDEALLHARALELARAQDEEQDEAGRDLLVLSVGGQRVALAVDDVASVCPPSQVAQVPGSNAILAGLVGGRGEPLAVASLARLLALTTGLPPDEQWVVVLHHPTAPLGLLVDTADDIVRIGEDQLSPTHEAGGLVVAIHPDGTLLLDAAALLRDPRVSPHSNDQTEEPSWRER